MCGCFGHGFWWKENDRFRVMFDFEINSHSDIIQNREIPDGAHKLGFDPADLKIVSNDDVELTEEVKQKASLLLDGYMTDKESIARWIKCNYAKNNDKQEWDSNLDKMLADEGVGFFSEKYYKQRVEFYKQKVERYKQEVEHWKQGVEHYKECWKQEVEHCKQGVEHWKQGVEHWKQEVEHCKQGVEHYKQKVERYKQQVERYKQGVEHYKQGGKGGTFDEMQIEAFIDYFLKNPNGFWQNRININKLEYKSFVEA